MLTFHCSLQDVQGTDFWIVIVALQKAKKEVSAAASRQKLFSSPTTPSSPSARSCITWLRKMGKRKIRALHRKAYYLYKLNVELPRERGNLSLDTQFPLFDAHRNDLIVSRAVSNSVKNVQVLHHHVAIQANIKYLQGGRNDSVRTDSGMRLV